MASANGVLPANQQNFLVALVAPIGVAISVGSTSSQRIVAFNANRRAITFANPGSVIIYICPDNVTANNVALGGMVALYPGSERTIIAEGNLAVNCGWNAIAASGANNPLTITDWAPQVVLVTEGDFLTDVEGRRLTDADGRRLERAA